MNKTVFFLLALLIVGGLFLWRYNNHLPEVFAWLQNKDEIKVFEERYTPEQIIRANKDKLAHEGISLKDPTLLFYPYVALKVTFPGNEGEKEKGILLWSLSTGEAVINADTWKMTNGFSEVIRNKASTDDFKLLQTISRNGGSITKEALQRRLHLDNDKIDRVIDKALQQKLIVNHQGHYRLAYEIAQIDMAPQTHFSAPLPTKNYVHVIKEKQHYTIAQIQEITLAAFGNSFSIEKSEEIYLPVYTIDVHNEKDGTTLQTYWNGMTGKRYAVTEPQ